MMRSCRLLTDGCLASSLTCWWPELKANSQQPPIISEDRVNKRGERRRLREDEQDAEQKQDDDDRQKPELLVLPQEQPDLTGERELAHRNFSPLRPSKNPLQ